MIALLIAAAGLIVTVIGNAIIDPGPRRMNSVSGWLRAPMATMTVAERAPALRRANSLRSDDFPSLSVHYESHDYAPSGSGGLSM